METNKDKQAEQIKATLPAHAKRALITQILLLLFAIGVIYTAMDSLDHAQGESLITREATRLTLVSHKVEDTYQSATDTSRGLWHALQSLTTTHDWDPKSESAPPFLNESSELFGHFFEAVPVVEAVQLIDRTGREWLALQRDLSTDESSVAADPQNLLAEPFFQEILVNAEKPVQISSVGSESMKLTPFRPFFRLTRNLTDRHGNLIAFLVVKVDLSAAYQLIKELSTENQVEIYGVTSSGLVVGASGRVKDWSFAAQNNKPELNLPTQEPQLWESLVANGEGSRQTDDGVYNFKAFKFGEEINKAANAGSRGFHGGVFQWINEDVLYAGTMMHSVRGFVILVILIVAVLAVMYNQARVRRFAYEAQQERHRAESMLSELRAEQVRRDRMLSIVSHEIRTPVSSIAMLTNTDPSEFLSHRDTLKRLSDHVLKLLTTLRLVSRPYLRQDIHIERTNVADVVAEALGQSASVVTSSDMSVSYDINPVVCRDLRTDRFRVVSAISNIIRNACLHSGGSRIWISAEIIDAVDLKDCDKLKIIIEDDGKGISDERKAELFQPFVRGETSAPGMGLGLHIVKTWMEEIKSTVACTDSPRGGARFEMVIPLEAAFNLKRDSEEEIKHALQLQALAKQRLSYMRVLIVEDDNLLRKMTGKLIEKQARSVTLTKNGREGLETFKKESFDLILTDYFMPVMDGRDMIKEIRKLNHEIIIVGVTAATIGAEIEELMEAGADAVLSKPLDIADVPDALAALIQEGRLPL